MLPFKYLYDYTDFFHSLLCILKFNILKTIQFNSIYYLYKFVDWEYSTFRLSIFRYGISKIVQ